MSNLEPYQTLIFAPLQLNGENEHAAATPLPEQGSVACPEQRRAFLWFFLGGLTKKEPGCWPEPAN
jgi:hypothetical protein